MKPARPRITKPHLSWRFERGAWAAYHRITWTTGGKRREKCIRLDWQDDPQRLDELYWQCEAGRHERQKRPERNTWRELIVAWRKDPRVQAKLAQSTQMSYRRDMDAIIEKNGDKAVKTLTRQQVRAIHAKYAETPRKADKLVTTISLLWNYAAQKLDWPLPENPAAGIDRYGTQREYLPWPEWMIAKLADAPETVRTACELILGTGQRPSAAITMRRDDFQGEYMTVRDEKGDRAWEVFCPADLRAYLARLPVKGAYVLAKNLTQPRGYYAVESAFRKWRAPLGDKAARYSLHGLRKLAIIRLAEAGCTDAEIQAVTGQTAQTVAYYRRLADPKKLSRAAQERRV